VQVYVQGKGIKLTPAKAIGKGGEADVYKIAGGKVVKVYKTKSHPDLTGMPEEQKMAEDRIKEHQQKLPAFPKGLPSRVITPIELAYDKPHGGRVAGYTMKFLKDSEVLKRYSERSFRQAGITNATVMDIFKDIYATVRGVHKSRVVVGDFNDLNTLVKGTEAYMIDADSWQFGKFLTRVFTAKFADPLLCAPDQIMLVKPHTAESDWYAFSVLLMECLLFVGPYGGVYRPKDKSKKIPHDKRPLERITVFNPEVKYPKPAIHYSVLPDELLQYFHAVFEEDNREEFPEDLLHNIRWAQCPTCQIEHARNICPKCKAVSPAAVKEVTLIRGEVTATRVFDTKGLILFATIEKGRLKWIYHENGQYFRETKEKVSSGRLDPHIRFRIANKKTLFGRSSQLITLMANEAPSSLTLDNYRTLPMFDANHLGKYWLKGGRLMRDGKLGEEYIGDVLQGQTLFWVGETFGFGFSQACMVFAPMSKSCLSSFDTRALSSIRLSPISILKTT